MAIFDETDLRIDINAINRSAFERSSVHRRDNVFSFIGDPHGRVDRLHFLFGMGLNFAIAFFAKALHFAVTLQPSATMTQVTFVLFAVVALMLVWSQFALNVRRLHDVGVSGWFVLAPWLAAAVAIAIDSIWGGDGSDLAMEMAGALAFAYIGLLLFWRGKPHDNRYGRKSRKVCYFANLFDR